MARSSGATENLLLLLALVPYVLDRGHVSVTEAATQFGRSEADIIRAVELIACAGVPGENLAYSHLDLFDIDWDLLESEGVITFWNTVALEHKPRFSAREASALIAGLQYLAAHPAYSAREDLQTVMQKLQQGSGSGPRGRIAVAQPLLDSFLHNLSDALDSKMSVEMVYHNKRGESGVRTVDPLVLESRDSVWYVRAWCHHRQALRTFRVDHIETLTVTEQPQGDHGSLVDDISPHLFEPSRDDITVTIECPASALPVIADYLPRGFPEPTDQDRVIVDIPFAHYGSLTRFVAANPTIVRVIQPESARQAVADFAKEALNRY